MAGRNDFTNGRPKPSRSFRLIPLTAPLFRAGLAAGVAGGAGNQPPVLSAGEICWTTFYLRRNLGRMKLDWLQIQPSVICKAAI